MNDSKLEDIFQKLITEVDKFTPEEYFNIIIEK